MAFIRAVSSLLWRSDWRRVDVMPGLFPWHLDSCSLWRVYPIYCVAVRLDWDLWRPDCFRIFADGSLKLAANFQVSVNITAGRDSWFIFTKLPMATLSAPSWSQKPNPINNGHKVHSGPRLWAEIWLATGWETSSRWIRTGYPGGWPAKRIFHRAGDSRVVSDAEDSWNCRLHSGWSVKTKQLSSIPSVTKHPQHPHHHHHPQQQQQQQQSTLNATEQELVVTVIKRAEHLVSNEQQRVKYQL